MLLVSIIFIDDTNVIITIKNVGNVCTHMSKWLTVGTTALILSERNIHNKICSKNSHSMQCILDIM